MTRQEFIAKFADDFLEYGTHSIADQRINKIQDHIGSMKMLYRIQGEEKPEWLNMNLVDDIEVMIKAKIMEMY